MTGSSLWMNWKKWRGETEEKSVCMTKIFSKLSFIHLVRSRSCEKKKRIVRLLCSEWAFHKDSKSCIRRTKCLTCHDNRSCVSKTKWLSHPVKMINLLLARLSDLFLTDLTAAAGHQMLLIYTSNLTILETHWVCSTIGFLGLERWYKKDWRSILYGLTRYTYIV